MEVSVVAREPARRDALAARVRLAGWRLREAVARDTDRADDSADPADLVLLDGNDVRDGRVDGARFTDRVVVVSSYEADLATQLDTWPVHGWALVAPDADPAVLSNAAAAAADGFGVAPARRQAATRRDATAVPVAAAAADDEGVIADALTPRERTVLGLMADGLSNREIAARLGITPHTAKFHVASILGKLGVTTRAAAVRRGLRRGWVAL